MTPEEAIQKLRGLPEEKQRKVLAALGPDERKGILTKLSASSAPQPEARTVGNYLKEGAYGIGRGLKNDTVGLAQMFMNPRESASQFALQAMAAPRMAAETYRTAPGTVMQRGAAAALRGLEEAPVIGPMVQHAEQGGDRMASPEGLGAFAEGVTTLEAPELAGRGVAKVLPKIPEVAKAGVRSVTGTGPKVIADLAKDTQAENEASQAKANDAKAVETKRSSLQKDIQDKSRELQARIETARESALRVGNEKYSGVNKVLSGLQADPETIGTALGDAEDVLRGSTRDTTLLKDMAKEYLGRDGRVPTYEDLQGDYSRLGKELSKGTLPGDVFHAYDVLHEAIGNEMQRLADSKGQGAQLTDARNYWRRMKQTFGKPTAARDAATKTLRTLTPEFAREESTGNAVRMLGSFDPEIPRAAGDVTTLRKGLKSLPKAKPTEAVTNKVGAEDIRAAKQKSLESHAQKIRSYTSKAAMYVTGYRSLVSIGRAMTGDLGALAQLPADLAEGGVVAAGGHAFASFIENPKIANMLTRATEADVSQIPPAMRGDLSSVVQAAQRRGIKVAPALIRAAQGSAVVGQGKKRIAAALQP